MLSVRNLLSPSNGEPIVSPTQDIVLGCYYMTSERDLEADIAAGTVPRGWGKVFSSLEEVQLAYDAGAIDLHAQIVVRTDRDGGETKRIETTVGRAIFEEALPADYAERFGHVLATIKKREMGVIVERLSDNYPTAEVAPVVAAEEALA